MALAFPPFGTALPAVDAPPEEGEIIAASTWRWDGVSGSVLVSSGFPLKPGQVTSSTVDEVRVYVNSVEQSVALHPLDGKFPDGSIRSLGIQFNYNLTNDTPVSSEVHINTGTSRGTSDISWTEPTRTIALKRAVIAPSNPSHLCGTMATLTPLTPATNDSGTNATWAAFAESSWTGVSNLRSGANAGTATYDHQSGLWNLYFRTGVRSWYQDAYDWAVGFKNEGIVANADIAGVSTLIWPLIPNTAASRPGTSESQWNPEGLTRVVAGDADYGNPNEAFGSGRWISIAAAYWITGYRQFKRLVAVNVNEQIGAFTASSMSPVWGHRFNLRYKYWATLIGYLLGCTTSMDTPTGYGAVASWNYDVKLDAILDALEANAWNITSDYRNGLVGQRQSTIDPVASGNPAANTQWGITNFQLSIIAEWLMIYYDNVYPDSRIPPWLKIMCDYWITQIKPWETGDYQGIEVDWVDTYLNLPPAAAAAPTFTANLVNGNHTMTYTGGNVPVDYLQPGHSFTGTGIAAGTYVGAEAVGYVAGSTSVPLTDSSLVTFKNATQTVTPSTLRIYEAPYDMMMMAPLFAWYYAYSGTALYNTWATRMSEDTTMIAMAQTKNWGEIYGGTRQAFLYYRNGGTVRGITGAHPTAYTNPAVQADINSYTPN